MFRRRGQRRERGEWGEHEGRPGDAGPHPLGASIDEFLRGLGSPGSAALDAIFTRWEEVVGPQVAAHARPISLSDTTLIVGVDAPAWATQLRFLSADFLRRLADLAGAGVVTAIEVRVRP